MRKPKCRKVRPMTRGDHGDVSYDFIAHAPHDSFVRVSVSEIEGGFTSKHPGGTLVIDLERVEGTVLVRWTDDAGKPREMTLTRKGG